MGGALRPHGYVVVNVDREGYLVNLGDWSPALAGCLAQAAAVRLTDAHWRVIDVARAFYTETGISPEMRPLVKLVRERVDPALGSSIALLKLFPGNPAKLVAKIGGLPRPTNCL